MRSRIYEIELEKRNKDMSDKRKTMVKTGDRSDKIRTYNYDIKNYYIQKNLLLDIVFIFVELQG